MPVVQAVAPGSIGIIKAALLNPLARFSISSKVSSGNTSSSSSLEPPASFEFCSIHPSGLSPLDIDIIKLTAQYTSVNGREFLGGLAQREQRNPQFDFLKPTHMLFSYFTSLVDAYAKVLLPSDKLRETVREKKDKFKCLEKAVGRWEWNRNEVINIVILYFYSDILTFLFLFFLLFFSSVYQYIQINRRRREEMMKRQ